MARVVVWTLGVGFVALFVASFYVILQAIGGA